MSKLVKKLKEVSQQESHPLGFGVKAKAKSLSMVLIAHLPEIKATRIKLAISGGADAIWFANSAAKAKSSNLSQVTPKVGNIPFGLDVGDNTWVKLTDAGCDFIVLNTDVLAKDLVNDAIGKVLKINTSIEDNLLVSIGQLPVDAVLLTEFSQTPLTVHQLMQYQKLISFCGKPAMAVLPSDTSDLEVMREIGIRGVVIDFNEADSPDKLSEVKELIKKLPNSNKKSQGTTYASLPGVQYSDDEDYEE